MTNPKLVRSWINSKLVWRQATLQIIIHYTTTMEHIKKTYTGPPLQRVISFIKSARDKRCRTFLTSMSIRSGFFWEFFFSSLHTEMVKSFSFSICWVQCVQSVSTHFETEGFDTLLHTGVRITDLVVEGTKCTDFSLHSTIKFVIFFQCILVNGTKYYKLGIYICKY